MEIQRIEKDIKKEEEKMMYENNNGGLRSFTYIIHKIKNSGIYINISHMVRDNFYFLTISLVILCITIIGSQMNPTEKTIKK